MTRCKKFALISIVVFLIVSFLLSFYVYFVVYPLVKNVSNATVHNMYSSVITDVAVILKDSEEFKENFFEYHKDDNGAITAIISNSYSINQANFLVQKAVFQALSRLSNLSVPVKLGAFTGSTLLAAYGPTVGIEIMPIGSVKCKFCSKFYNSGLNQTVHKIFIEVTTDIDLMLPLENITITEKSEILIAENLIVGKVPDTYLEGDETTDYLDLVP